MKVEALCWKKAKMARLKNVIMFSSDPTPPIPSIYMGTYLHNKIVKKILYKSLEAAFCWKVNFNQR